ncbi:MAG: dockerin type I repeat-containing protein [Spirochaetales bacterium]|nr:dockerin type I repeat-containing protein [Spirochaetales bacterium]
MEKKKKKFAVLVLLMFLFSIAQGFAQECGDVNSNGTVDIVDALLIAQYYVQLDPTGFVTSVADVNGDNEINIVDALQIARYYINLINGLNCPNTPTPTPQAPNCTPNPTPQKVNVNFTGSSFTGSHQVVVETDPGLPKFTIFRPSDLAPGKKYPIASWGQGACSTDGLSNTEYCGQLASHGYLVIADGTPNGSGGGCGTAYSMDLRGGVCLLDAIKWAIRENDNPCSQYYQSLDATKTAAFGFSCGGIMAEGAGSMKDPVLTTFMPVSSGMTSANQSVIDSFQTPVLFLEGGTSDMAYANGKRDFQAIKNGAVPAMFVSRNVGHGGTLNDDNGGLFGQVTLAWLNWWLKDDMSATGKGFLVGSTCNICRDSAWEMASKNLP